MSPEMHPIVERGSLVENIYIIWSEEKFIKR